MKRDVFDYSDYKRYLRDFIGQQPQKGYGLKSKIANALSCKPSFLSQILNGSANLNFEQAEILTSYLGHTEEESEYFLLLIQFARAGSKALESRWKKQIEKRQQQRLFLKNRVDIKNELSKDDQVIYYSSWIYAAIHITTTIKEFRTKAAIAEHLQIPLQKAAEALDFLTRIGLLEFRHGFYVPGVQRVFLGSDSKMILQHHTNWRLRAIDSLNKDLENNLHLSTVVSIAAKDILAIKEILAKGIDQARGLIRESVPEEKVFCLNVDFFKISI